MAEINISGNNRQKGAVRRCKKLSTKVDLTPMVDLGFLLITFFVFTTSMSKPKAMNLYLPAGDSATTPAGESTVLTIIPVTGDKVFYYHGDWETARQVGLYGTTNFSITAGIGDIIRQKQTALDKSPTFTRNDLMLIIKPTAEASYRNVVAALDEILINAVKHYAFLEPDPAEKAALTGFHLLQ
jgi:Biopolymer transport protein ExbD/TolR